MIRIVRLRALGIALVLVAIVSLACANEPQVADQGASSSLSAEQVERIISKALDSQAMETAAASAGPTAEEIGTIVSEAVAEATSSSLSAEQVEQIVSKALESQAMETVAAPAGPTAEEIGTIVSEAVAESRSSSLSAEQVEQIISKALETQAMETATAEPTTKHLEPKVEDRDIYVPSTISPEAQQLLGVLKAAKAYAREVPSADADLEVWRQAQDAIEEASVEANEKAVADNKVTVIEATLGGVPVLDIRPENWTDNGKVLVYTHGGAYVAFSARSTLENSAKMTRATGLRVISVDYTLAPHARWDGRSR